MICPRLRRFLPCIVGVIVCLAQCGCDDSRNADRKKILQSDHAKRSVDDLEAGLNFIAQMNQFEPRQAAIQAAFHLNKWSASKKRPEDWEPDPMAARLPSSLRDLASPKELGGEKFSTIDVDFLEGTYWLSRISRWGVGDFNPRLKAWIAETEHGLNEEQREQLLVAERLFDWTIRNIQLDQLTKRPPDATAKGLPAADAIAGPGYRYTASQALMYGHGDAWQRARVFILLARQQGIPVVMLSVNRVTGPDEPWLPAVLLGEQLYLFDTQLGMPIPAGDNRGVATLTQARENPAVLDQLNASELKYPFTHQDIQSVTTLIDAAPRYLSLRMKLLEPHLAGDRQMVVTASPSKLAQRLRKCKGVSQARLWTVPYESILFQRAVDARLSEGGAASQVLAAFGRERALFGGRQPLSEGRRLHLHGVFHVDGPQADDAKRQYLRMRLDKQTLSKLQNDPVAQKSVGLVRGRTESQSSWQRRLLSAIYVFQQGKEHATYWLGLVHYDSGDLAASAEWLDERSLSKSPEGPWSNGARYNLARVYERQGKLEDARRLLLLDESPQRLGNRIRARLIRLWSEAEAKSS